MLLRRDNANRGFTLTEVMVSIGIVTVIMAITTISLSGASRKASLSASVDVLVADTVSQRQKAMLSKNDQEGYGIHLEQNNYILFQGTTYDPEAPANFQVDLEPSIEIANITIPDSQLIFLAGSGEVQNFTTDENTFILVDTTGGNAKTFTINALGSVESLQ